MEAGKRNNALELKMISTKTYVFLFAFTLAVVLDVIIIRRLRRRNKNRMAASEDVKVLGRYSPALTWIRTTWAKWRAGKGDAAMALETQANAGESDAQDKTKAPSPMDDEPNHLSDRIRELEGQVAALEQQQSSKSPLDFTQNGILKEWKQIVLSAAAVALAGIPAFLVFQDRWLGSKRPEYPFGELWKESVLLIKSGLPEYFGLGILSMLALLILILIWRPKNKLEFHIGFGNKIDRWARPGTDKKQNQIGIILIGVSAFIMVIAVLVSLRTGIVEGWFYLAGLGFFVAGGIYLDDHKRIFDKIKTLNWFLILSALLAHLSLIVVIRNIVFEGHIQWVFILLFLVLSGNLVRQFRQIPKIYWIVNLAVILFSLQLNSWAFSVAGDDFAFYTTASEIVQTQSLWIMASNLFDGALVYGTHPYLSSLIQAISMKLFGLDNFGWRFSNVYLSALSIAFFYFFFNGFFPKRYAHFAAFFLATSSYLMSFSKIGYNNLQALFAMSLALAAASWALRSDRKLAYMALGFSLGFCFYVYPAALYALPLPILLLYFYRPADGRPMIHRWILALASAFLICLPLLTQPMYWAAKVPGLYVNNPEIMQSAHSLRQHFAINALDAFFSFLYLVNETHFVVTAYSDPLSGMLILIGLAYSIKRSIRERMAAYISISFILLILMVGASHDRLFPPTTRMFMLLPWFAMFAATGLWWLLTRLVEIGLSRQLRVRVIILLMVGILGLNLYQAYPMSRQRSASMQTTEVLFVRLADEIMAFEPKSIEPVTVVFLTNEDWGIIGFQWILRIYDYPASRINIKRVVMDGAAIPAAAEESIRARNTILIIQPGLDETWKAALASNLKDAGKQACEIMEATGKDIRFVMWHSPDLASLCFGIP